MNSLFDALITQVWQISAIVGLIWFLNRLLSNNRPHLSHALWIIVLMKCLMPPTWSSPVGLFSWIESMPFTRALNSTKSSTQVLKNEMLDSSNGQSSSDPSSESAADELQATSHFPLTRATIHYEVAPKMLPGPPIANFHAQSTGAFFDPSYSKYFINGCVYIWLMGTFAWFLISLLRVRFFMRRLWNSKQPTPIAIQKTFQNLTRNLGLRFSVRLLITSERIGPAVIGLFHPTILLPSVILSQRSAKQIEPLLAHELVHIRRGDTIVAAAQLVAQCLWWFNPLIWFVGRRIVHESERCCDEEVIARLGCSPTSYANGLIDVLERKQNLRAVPLFPGVRPIDVTSKRLERIMKLGQGCRKKSPWWCWAIIAIGCAIILPSTAALTAQTHKSEEDKFDAIKKNHVVTKPSAEESQQGEQVLPKTDHITQSQLRLVMRVYPIENIVITPPDLIVFVDSTSQSVGDYIATHPKTAFQSVMSPIIDEIYELIADGSWKKDGGEATIAPFVNNVSLVVSQTQKNHEKIANFLFNPLRRKSQFTVAINRLGPIDSEQLKHVLEKLFQPATQRQKAIEFSSSSDVYSISEDDRNALMDFTNGSASIENEVGPMTTLQVGQQADLIFTVGGSRESRIVRLKFETSPEKEFTLRISTRDNVQSNRLDNGNSFVVVIPIWTLGPNKTFDVAVITPKLVVEGSILGLEAQEQQSSTENSHLSTAFDFAFPVNRDGSDNRQHFSFNVGLIEQPKQRNDMPIEQNGVYYTGGKLPGGEWPIPANGKLDVLEAIRQSSQSAGDNSAAGILGEIIFGDSTRSLIILRKSSGGPKEAIPVDLLKTIKDPNPRPLIQNGDTLILE